VALVRGVENLEAAGSHTSYCLLEINGRQVGKTQNIGGKEENSFYWNEEFIIKVYQPLNEVLSIQIRGSDGAVESASRDPNLGEAAVRLEDVIKHTVIDRKFKIGAGLGEISLKLSWRSDAPLVVPPAILGSPADGGLDATYVSSPGNTSHSQDEIVQGLAYLGRSNSPRPTSGQLDGNLGTADSWVNRHEWVNGNLVRRSASRSPTKLPARAGFLFLTLKSASNLRNLPNTVGTRDAFCSIEVGGKEYRTKTVPNDHNPKWDENIKIALLDAPEKEVITVTVLDDDGIVGQHKGGIFGDVAVKVSDVISTGPLERGWKLGDTQINDEGKTGTPELFMKISFEADEAAKSEPAQVESKKEVQEEERVLGGAPTRKQGWLMKKGGGKKEVDGTYSPRGLGRNNWNKRFFLLQGPLLKYHESSAMVSSLFSGDLTTCEVLEGGELKA